jgi:hypothetical protein
MKPTHVTIEALLNDPSSLLEWVEPASGVSADGAPVTVTMISRASVADCIALQRSAAAHAYLAHVARLRSASDPSADGPRCINSDRELLLDFMAVHWAVPVAGK